MRVKLTYIFNGKEVSYTEAVKLSGLAGSTVVNRAIKGIPLDLPLIRNKPGDGYFMYGGRLRSAEQIKSARKRLTERYYRSTGREPVEKTKSKTNEVFLDGKRYKSYTDLSKETGRTRDFIADVVKRVGTNRLTAADITPKVARATPFFLDGIKYESVADCSRKTGIKEHKLYRIVKIDREPKLS
jgi:hypothetical protein